MKATADSPAMLTNQWPLIGNPDDIVPASGTYRCLCCGVVLWHLRKGHAFPECPSPNCPTMWMWDTR